MASYQFKDTVFSTDTELAQPQLGTLTQVAENNLLSTRDYTLIVTVTNINTNVVVQLDGSIDGTNYAQIIGPQTITANGHSVFSVSGRPVKFVRPRFVPESRGTAALITLSVAAA